MSKNIIFKLIKDIDKYPLLRQAFEYMGDENRERYIDAIDDYRREKFSMECSPIHGEWHSEKVALFAFLLGIKQECSYVELEMLLDAGKYHDFMRRQDTEEPFHGYASAINIANAVDVSKYSEEELNILKFIIYYHDLDEKSYSVEAEADEFNVSGDALERAKLLAYILKDADALDRKRFSDDSFAALKLEFLHSDVAKEMADLSEEVNNGYLNYMFTNDEIINNVHLYSIFSGCKHSIGKNLFRVASVLKHGLLSKEKADQLGIGFGRNFDGCNSRKWISVVPNDESKTDDGATSEFLNNGIVLLIDDIPLFYPDENVGPNYAKSYGLPYKKSVSYDDEKFAFLHIEPDKINGISIAKDLADTDLRDLNVYVYNSFSFNMFYRNVSSYFDGMGIDINSMPDEFKNDLIAYRYITSKFSNIIESDALKLQETYVPQLMNLCSRINGVIGECMHNYYASVLGVDSDSVVTFRDALEYELAPTDFINNVSVEDDKVVYRRLEKEKSGTVAYRK